ncbi:MAG: extracellular solute-binding protein, partial [Acholeplasmataceae bacterium]|nr:extracellular solute-binding protein [Acholeplasmataceae bacterium]
GDLPDLYMYATVPTAVSNGWAHDMTSIMANDPELAKVSDDIATGAVYNDKYFGIPQSNFYFGYFINRTLFERENLDSPAFGVTWDDLLDFAQDISTTPEDGTGIVGFSGVDRIFEWMPAQYDGSLGWYTYNDEGFHLDSQAFASAMELMQGFYDENKGQYAEYVWETSSVSQKATWYAEGEGTQFQKGRHAIMWDATWSWGWILPNLLDEEEGLYGMDIDFIGTPVVVDGVQRIPVVLDYLVAGQGTEHPEEAYLLAKWLGFGKEGYLKRLEIASEFPEAGSVNFAPLQKDDELFDAYLALFPAGTMTEYRKVLEHDSFIIEGVKTVPGYVSARWNYQYGTYEGVSYTIASMLDAIRDGNVTLADVAVQLNQRVNEAHDQAWVALNNAMND